MADRTAAFFRKLADRDHEIESKKLAEYMVEEEPETLDKG